MNNGITGREARGEDVTEVKERLLDMFGALYGRYGPQHWWPAESAFECVVGAILTQNTAWRNVEKAVANLKRAGMLSPRAIVGADEGELAALITPSGYFNQKARRLKEFARFLVERYGGSLERMAQRDGAQLREELLSITGIGPETADSILLYAVHKSEFVVDAYTMRVLRRHGLVDENASYDDAKQLFMRNLPHDAGLFNEFHALFVRVGKEHCAKRNPLCKGCPLEWDPHDERP